MQTLLARKPFTTLLAEADEPEFHLRRTLGPVAITLLGIGAIVGAGIFATIGTAAAGDASRPGAGPALILSFVLTAVVCGFTALAYAELASMVPISGSAYTYSYATLGELIAWIIGWDLIIEYAVGNVAVAVSWANYFRTLCSGFGLMIPDWVAMDYRTAAHVVDAAGAQTVFRDAPHVLGVPIVFNFLALGIVTLITLVLIWGIRESARLNAIMVVLKLVVLAFFVCIGLYYVKPAHFVPFAPNGWAGISAAAAIVFFAYIGFDAVSTVAEETRDPQRNLPIGIISSLIICTVIYVAVAAVFTGLIPYEELRSSLSSEKAEPLTMALRYASPNMNWAIGIVAFGAVVANTAVLLVFQLGQPRIFFAMARDGLLPQAMAKVHKKFRTPWVATIVTGVAVGMFAGIATIDEMVDLTNIGTLAAFILVCAGIIALRLRDPERKRPFRVPSGWTTALVLYAALAIVTVFLPVPLWVKLLVLMAALPVFSLLRNHIVPSLGIVSCMYLIYYLPPSSWLRFAAWLNLGFLMYAAYGSVHSRLTGRHLAEDASVHDARTCYQSAWLYVAGVAMLFFMHGLDVVLQAHKDAAASTSALSTLLAARAWLTPSAFLLVPLILDAIVLGPTIWHRGWRAWRATTVGLLRRRVITAWSISSGLVILSCVYVIAALAG